MASPIGSGNVVRSIDVTNNSGDRHPFVDGRATDTRCVCSSNLRRILWSCYGLFAGVAPPMFKPASHGELICGGIPPKGW